MAQSLNTLTANIKREWLARILDGSKKIEYREATEYWMSRLAKVGPPPFQLRLINGMRPDSPEATVLVEKVDVDILDSGEIRLHITKILETLRWDPDWRIQYPPLPPDPPRDLSELFREPLFDSKIRIEVSSSVLHSLAAGAPITFTLPSPNDAYDNLMDTPEGIFIVHLIADGQAQKAALLEVYERTFESVTDYVVIAVPERLNNKVQGA